MIFFIPFNVEYIPSFQEDCTLFDEGDFFTRYGCTTFAEKEELECPGPDWCSAPRFLVPLVREYHYNSMIEYLLGITSKP